MYTWHTYQVSFHSVVWCVYTGRADLNFRWRHQNIFVFFRILCTPLLHDADIYTSTLILYNSFNYNLIDTKLGSILHLLFFYQYSELYVWPNILVSVLYSIVLIVDMQI